jgi:hypothetical protein
MSTYGQDEPGLAVMDYGQLLTASLISGAGAAGCRLAIEVRDCGAEVVLLAKSRRTIIVSEPSGGAL